MLGTYNKPGCTHYEFAQYWRQACWSVHYKICHALLHPSFPSAETAHFQNCVCVCLCVCVYIYMCQIVCAVLQSTLCNYSVDLWFWRVLCTLIKPIQWLRGLRRGSAAAHLLTLRARILPRTCMSCASYECCVLIGTGLCVRPITRPEKSYRLWCVWMR